MGWPHGHDGGRERAPRPAVHDESGSAHGGVGGHAASSGGLGGAGWRLCAAPLSGGRKAAAGVGHGAAHLLLLVADVRKRPGARAVQEQGGGDGEQGDIEALSRSTTSSEENDSALKCSLNFTEPDFDNALQVFDRMIWQ